jgi:hypothetical protein
MCTSTFFIFIAAFCFIFMIFLFPINIIQSDTCPTLEPYVGNLAKTLIRDLAGQSLNFNQSFSFFNQTLSISVDANNMIDYYLITPCKGKEKK